MAVLGFSSFAEVYVYATCVLLGISMLMPLNALTSAPAYMVNYYKYVTGNEDAVPNSTVFWANILTFYNLISVPTQIIVGPTVLLPWARKLSLNTRFIFALSFMMIEVFVILIMPIGKVSQNGAIAAFVIVTIAAGAGKSYLEATCYALVGTMKPKFMSAVMFGCGFSGVIASVIQCIIKASMADDYETVLKQAYIYFSLALGFMVTSMLMAVGLRWNSYAQKHVAEYKMLKRSRDIAAGIVPEDEETGHNALEGIEAVSATEPVFHGDSDNCSGVAGGRIVTSDDVNRAGKEEEDDVVRAVEMGDMSSSLGDDNAVAQQNMTTAEQLQNTRVWPVVKEIYPMQIACFCIFFISLLLFPSLVIPIDRTSKWFATIAILCYNCGDATGRLSSSFKLLWPSRKVVLVVSFCRLAFVPLVFLCIYHYIPSHAAPCVIMACVGLTNGFFGATAMVFGPETPTLKTEGQRVMAGQLMGISLLAGASVAALLAMLVVIFLP